MCVTFTPPPPPQELFATKPFLSDSHAPSVMESHEESLRKKLLFAYRLLKNYTQNRTEPNEDSNKN